MSLLEKLRDLFNPKNAPDNPPAPAPAPAKPVSVFDYAKIASLLRGVDFKKIWPALLSVPVILFFTATGMLVWGVLLISLICRIFCWGFGC